MYNLKISFSSLIVGMGDMALLGTVTLVDC